MEIILDISLAPDFFIVSQLHKPIPAFDKSIYFLAALSGDMFLPLFCPHKIACLTSLAGKF
jgi:hypothetical protein